MDGPPISWPRDSRPLAPSQRRFPPPLIYPCIVKRCTVRRDHAARASIASRSPPRPHAVSVDSVRASFKPSAPIRILTYHLVRQRCGTALIPPALSVFLVQSNATLSKSNDTRPKVTSPSPLLLLPPRLGGARTYSSDRDERHTRQAFALLRPPACLGLLRAPVPASTPPAPRVGPPLAAARSLRVSLPPFLPSFPFRASALSTSRVPRCAGFPPPSVLCW